MEKGNILIIDDEPIVRDVLSDMLGCVGGHVTDYAVDGSEGINKIKNNEYDLIFTDLKMPKLNGIDFLREAKSINPSTPVVVITGYSTLDNAITAMKEGARDFITKPFKIDEIASLVNIILGEMRLLKRISESGDDRVSIERANRELFKRLEEISILQAISTELDSLYNNKEIYERIVEMVSRLLKVKEASFCIVSNGCLKTKKASGREKKDVTIDGTLFEKVIKEKNYCLASYGEIDPYSGAPLTSPIFSIPFVINDEVFGLLNLSNKIDGSSFKENEISLALTFSRKAALRIENNALYDVLYNNLVNTLKSFVLSIEARDPYTKHHSERVTLYALQIAEVMNIGSDDKDAIGFGGYLHDIGKIGVRDTVLLKPGKLSDEEMEEIKLHPIVGDDIIRPLNFFPKERELIRHHHEKFDGSGYPDNLAGDKIPLIARILQIADTYDAMTSTRPYRKALGHDVAVKELKRFAHTQFDGEVVHAFLQTPAGKGKGHEA